ncbi:hypothetical protein GCM10009117_22360 [Gangjinia marincola]|uniref:Putative auto-transporter adhesin head GIN domain-containing protein n=1 Tax=Gangjinia marincola TaxID=578463 RepID=A0ABN1MIR0_9FLAO
MKKFILALFSILLLVSCGSTKKAKIEGNKEVVTVSNNIQGSFNSVEISDDIKVKMKQGFTDNYVLTTDENLVSVVQFKVVDSVLRIYTTQRITKSKELNVYLTAQNLEYISLRNDSRFESDGLLTTDFLSVTGSGGSQIEIDIETTQFNLNLKDNSLVEVDGKAENIDFYLTDRSDVKGELDIDTGSINLQESAEFDMEGKANEVSLTIAGGTHYNGTDFELKTAQLTALDKSEVNVLVSDNVTVYAKDKTTINLYGRPEVTVKTLSDRATINKK